MANAEVLFSFDDAARTMGITPERLDKLIEEGKVQTVHRSAQLFVPREAILRYLAGVSSVTLKDRKK